MEYLSSRACACNVKGGLFYKVRQADALVKKQMVF